MYGRVTYVEGTPEQLEQGTAYVREHILPAARALDGFRGMLSLGDRESGKALSITFWESEEAMRASEEAANQMRAGALPEFGGENPTVERYEILINAMAPRIPLEEPAVA